MVVKKKVDGFSWYLDVSDGGIGRTLYHSNTTGEGFSFSRECAFMHILNETIKPGMTCIDLGANIGYATMIMLRNVGPTGFVYALEPDNHNLKFLTININQNGFFDPNLCEITRCLITDQDGESPFWIAKHPNLNSVRKTKHSIRQENIPCFKLGTFCSSRKYPNFIKMDIEGHEVSVFESGYQYFKENDGETHILLEIHPHFYNDDNDFAAILKKYFEIGFHCSYAISTPIPEPKVFLEKGYKPEKVVSTDGFLRGIYRNIDNDDIIDIACKENVESWQGGVSKKIARSIMLSREQKGVING